MAREKEMEEFCRCSGSVSHSHGVVDRDTVVDVANENCQMVVATGFEWTMTVVRGWFSFILQVEIGAKFGRNVLAMREGSDEYIGNGDKKMRKMAARRTKLHFWSSENIRGYWTLTDKRRKRGCSGIVAGSSLIVDGECAWEDFDKLRGRPLPGGMKAIIMDS